MTPIQETIINKKTTNTPIWLMRQAGRYLPEFRKIREVNPNFINLCLNENLSSEITLQPLKRFKLDAAIIFSDILMLPYGLNQKVEFKKNFGPQLGPLNIEIISKIDQDLIKKVKVFDVYEGDNIPEGKKSIALNVTIQSSEKTLKDEDLDRINQLIISTVESKSGAKIRS